MPVLRLFTYHCPTCGRRFDIDATGNPLAAGAPTALPAPPTAIHYVHFLPQDGAQACDNAWLPRAWSAAHGADALRLNTGYSAVKHTDNEKWQFANG